ncbi:MAG: glycosyltransferase family 4 protein [bacterium]
MIESSANCQSERRTKIVRIIARLNIGGPAIHVVLLSAGLDTERYETVLVKGRESETEGDMMAFAQQRGVEPVIINRLGRDLNPISDLATLWRVYRLLRRERPDIVHTHTAKAGTLGRIAARLAGVPVVIHTFHGHVLSGYFGPFKTRLFTAIERLLARWSNAIISVSETCRRDLLTLGIADKEKMVTIPLGLELDRFPERVPQRAGQFRKRFGIPPDAPIVSHVARMVPIKRHDVFLRAIPMVLREKPDVRFALVGDGETRPALEDLARDLQLDNRLIWTGFIEEQELIYADMDLLVLTSDNEGLPVAVIEALASARPVIATRVGGVPELITDGVNGYTVEPNNPEQLAEALLKALSNMDRLREMGRAGQQKVLERYNHRRLIHDVDELYQKLLNRAKP